MTFAFSGPTTQVPQATGSMFYFEIYVVSMNLLLFFKNTKNINLKKLIIRGDKLRAL